MKSLFVSFACLLILPWSIHGVLGEILEQLTSTVGDILQPASENKEYETEQNYLKLFKRVDDEALTCGQLIESRGFRYERHFVTTDDGYIIQLYRIINPYAKAAYGKKLKPVLLVHGVLLSCSCWMFNQPDGHIEEWSLGVPPNVTSSSLAFVLANLEFDVWLGNNRGTSYSTNHTTLNPSKDREFWDFSFADMGTYDFPAMINYVTNTTGFEKIVYIGMSQGNLQMFLSLSDDPSLADKLDLNIAIAPVGSYEVPPILLYHALQNPVIEELTRVHLLGPFPHFVAEFDATLSVLCSNPALKKICTTIYFLIFGYDPKMLNGKRFPVITSLIDSIPEKSITHFAQVILAKEFRKFDYGSKKNLATYGTEKAPGYNFSRIPTHNLVLISGLNDNLASPANVAILKKRLSGPPLVDYVVPYPDWNHVDPIFGLEAYKYCHSVIVDLLRKYAKA
uniref:Partial AB-hydrolase lipase domain-containing protein n=2 Tax=Tetranychus urticae TaxID=32264 RepID=T1KPQ7_TETUR